MSRYTHIVIEVILLGKYFEDLTGKRFGNVVVLGECGRANDGHVSWICRCDCGNEIIARSNNLINGHTKSCGMHRRIVSRTKKSHVRKNSIKQENKIPKEMNTL